jgi:purine-binding chemotaxis protein CheW
MIATQSSAARPGEDPTSLLAAALGSTGQLLRLAVGRSMFAVPIDLVREILKVGQMTALPLMPAFVRGVMNLRGAVVPVIDLVARLGHPPAQIGRRSCVVVVESAPQTDDSADTKAEADGPHAETLVVGLLVDAVYEVFDAPPGDFEPVPQLGTRIDASYLRGMSRVRGEVIGVLALERVLAQHELGALIASHMPH